MISQIPNVPYRLKHPLPSIYILYARVHCFTYNQWWKSHFCLGSKWSSFKISPFSPAFADRLGLPCKLVLRWSLACMHSLLGNEWKEVGGSGGKSSCETHTTIILVEALEVEWSFNLSQLDRDVQSFIYLHQWVTGCRSSINGLGLESFCAAETLIYSEEAETEGCLLTQS